MLGILFIRNSAIISRSKSDHGRSGHLQRIYMDRPEEILTDRTDLTEGNQGSFLRRELSERSADRGNRDKAPGIKRQEMETNVDNQSGDRDWVPEMD